jgi:branched-chain amino acid transport system permease protein
LLQIFIQVLIAGLAMGAVYALVSLGFTLIWNAVSVVNFAQGDFVTLGAFVGVGWLVLRFGAPVWAQLLAICAFMAAFGLLVGHFLYNPLRNSPQVAVVVATLGLSMLLENSVVLVWGLEPLPFTGPLGNATVKIFGAIVYAQYILILAAGLALMVFQELVFRFTLLGRAMRATAQDQEAARLMGIPTRWVIAAIFAWACILAGIAGWLVAPLFFVSADLGVVFSVKAFAAAILGGFGSILGALIGGLMLGVIESMSSFYISTEFSDSIAFLILLLVLILRPQGIFGESGAAERP